MGSKILAINPGSTSTKVALYDDEHPLLELTLRHSAEEIARFDDIISQLDWRREIILSALREQHFDIRELAVVIGRGGLVKPIPAGVYEVNDAMRHDLRHASREHASNLCGLLAADIAAMAGVKAYIADPVVVDEMDDVARMSGLPDCPRRSILHALNQKATVRLHCERVGLVYEEHNFIVAHLGGGISVTAHKRGRMVDTNNALDGDGPIAPERAGSLPTSGLADLCFSGRYTRHDVERLLAGKGAWWPTWAPTRSCRSWSACAPATRRPGASSRRCATRFRRKSAPWPPCSRARSTASSSRAASPTTPP